MEVSSGLRTHFFGTVPNHHRPDRLCPHLHFLYPRSSSTGVLQPYRLRWQFDIVVWWMCYQRFLGSEENDKERVQGTTRGRRIEWESVEWANTNSGLDSETLHEGGNETSDERACMQHGFGRRNKKKRKKVNQKGRSRQGKRASGRKVAACLLAVHFLRVFRVLFAELSAVL